MSGWVNRLFGWKVAPGEGDLPAKEGVPPNFPPERKETVFSNPTSGSQDDLSKGKQVPQAWTGYSQGQKFHNPPGMQGAYQSPLQNPSKIQAQYYEGSSRPAFSGIPQPYPGNLQKPNPAQEAGFPQPTKGTFPAQYQVPFAFSTKEQAQAAPQGEEISSSSSSSGSKPWTMKDPSLTSSSPTSESSPATRIYPGDLRGGFPASSPSSSASSFSLSSSPSPFTPSFPSSSSSSSSSPASSPFFWPSPSGRDIGVPQSSSSPPEQSWVTPSTPAFSYPGHKKEEEEQETGKRYRPDLEGYHRYLREQGINPSRPSNPGRDLPPFQYQGGRGSFAQPGYPREGSRLRPSNSLWNYTEVVPNPEPPPRKPENPVIYKPDRKRYNAVTLLQSVGVQNPYIAPGKVLQTFADEMERTTNPEEVDLLLKRYKEGYRRLEQKLREGDPHQISESMISMFFNLPVRELDPETHRLKTVEKRVFKTIDQLKRSEAMKAGITTARGHGLPGELPVLAYLNEAGKKVYLSKVDRLRCLRNELPNAPTCPNPPFWNEMGRMEKSGKR